jgi:DNA repair exonuclease SbcCD ATPase subunit
MTDDSSKMMHAQKQKELMDKISELEKAIKYEDEVTKVEANKIEKRCIEIEYEIKDLESAHETMKQEKFLERKAEQKKQEKKLELADKLIGELKKENKRLRKQHVKVAEKLNKLDGTSQKIEDMNYSLSSLCNSIGNLADVAETKYETLQEEHDATRELNKDMKAKLRANQDNYWEVAQSRLEYQKSMAKILTLIQDHLNSVDATEDMVDAAREMTKITLQLESEAKVQMAAVDIETAGTSVLSDTSYTQVNEIIGHDSDPYLEITLAPQRKPSQ